MTNMAFSGQTFPSATLNCPKCQTAITYYDLSGSSYFGCPNCRTFFKYENEGPPEILTTFQPATSTPVFSIGSEGYLNGQFVRVVGVMHKKEADAYYNWLEYILLRQDGKYSQLAEYNGHWTVIEPTEQTYSHYHVGGRTYTINTNEGQYGLYNQYKPELLNAVGEFDWNILDDENLTISEYIRPPSMLVSEQGPTGSKWYKASYISRADLATAFGISKDILPTPSGVGAIEPADPDDRSGALLAFTGMFLVAVFVLQIILSIAKPSKQLIRESYQTDSDSSGMIKPIITPSFDVDGPTALAFNMSASLDNQWIELPITLINEQSGRVYEFSKTLEYYHGVEGGESWSEGSRDDDAVLSRIPAGRYHLNIYPARDPGQSVSFRISVTQNTMLGSNIVLLLLLVGIYPIILFVNKHWHESQRWSNSDYSKTYTESDNLPETDSDE